MIPFRCQSDFAGCYSCKRHRSNLVVLPWTGSLPSGRVDITGDEDPTDEDGDTGMGDSTRVSVSLGGEISSGGKKSQE
ncbi:hypothetical protein Tco_0638346 [Tanacetum coccineum]